ncbi:hypothetical protein B0H15DRAFT_270671 [Mycena belliarum]|uniref:HIT-type domain-containing protein n=1 Tax=Mycena belliarum TaxID=1033014 RepID=A0AAD6XMW0_9AGAR|nr:hypothetical protein B0H15DRAFT_270671 [Mycena belliae]
MQTASLPLACSAPHKKRQRQRTLSTVSVPPAGSAPKINIAPLRAGSTCTACPAAAGAFTLTGCARAALRCLAPGESDSSGLGYGFGYGYGYDDDSDRDDATDSPPASPRSIASVPSISRTASPCEGERAPIPPGWGVRSRREWAQEQRQRKRAQQKQKQKEEWPQKQKERDRSSPNDSLTRIHPVLDALERASRVGTGRVACAACTAPGANFPRCARCAKPWCSRECRTSAAHQCAPRPRRTHTT